MKAVPDAGDVGSFTARYGLSLFLDAKRDLFNIFRLISEESKLVGLHMIRPNWNNIWPNPRYTTIFRVLTGTAHCPRSNEDRLVLRSGQNRGDMQPSKHFSLTLLRVYDRVKNQSS